MKRQKPGAEVESDKDLEAKVGKLRDPSLNQARSKDPKLYFHVSVSVWKWKRNEIYIQFSFYSLSLLILNKEIFSRN